MTRRRLIAALSATCLFAVSLQIPAQGPARGTVSLVVPYPAGGASDVLARAFAPAFAKALERVVVVENLSGASGSIGATKVARGAADGSLVLVGSPTETILAPLTIKGLAYSAGDFKLLGILYTAPMALYGRPGLKADSIDELSAMAKRVGSAPINYGSPGTGSHYHIVTENLRKAIALDATHVPYRGGAPMLQDLMAGTIDLAVLPVDNVLGSLVDGGKIKVLGVAAPQRALRYPTTPTFDESAAARGFGYPGVWVGIFLPQRTPDAVTAQWHQAVLEVLGQEPTRHALASTGGFVPQALAWRPAQAFYAEQTRLLTAMARTANVRAD